MSSSFSPSASCDIAVVGTAALYADSRDPAEFWRNIVSGRDLLTEVPRSHWLPEDFYDPDPKKPGKVYSKRGSFLPEIDFDPLEFGVPPSILAQTDAAQVLTLWATQQLLGQTESLRTGKVGRERVSIAIGCGATELTMLMAAKIQRPIWEKAMRAAGIPEPQVAVACDRIFASYPDWTEATFPGILGNVIAGRVANRFDFGGANFTVDAACASSFAAVAIGIQQLRLGESDVAIVGGADTLNNPHMYMCFSKTPALSPTEDCRPFSDRADGTMMGEGVGLMALRRRVDAERDGDRILAIIRGVGVGSDGRAKSVYAPRPEGQARSLARAYEQAGFSAAEIGLVEAHGTGTVAGDAAEFEGLRQLFGPARPDEQQWCALGSIKSQFGHTKAAAGVAGLFKVVMALHHRVLPPTIKVERPNPAMKLAESPFYLNTRTRPWLSAGGKPRRAAVSSFGFGGTNFHLVLEEYVPASAQPRHRLRTAPKELLPLCADDAAGLTAAIAAVAAEPANRAWTATAHAQQRAFRPTAPLRLVVLAADRVEALKLAEEARARLAAEPTLTWAQRPGAWWLARGSALGPVAFLFPGQGSQYVGMGGELACEFDVARTTWEHALTQPGLAGLAELAYPKPGYTDEDRARAQAALTRTENAQPALGAASLALLELLRRAGVTPAMTGGHSYGELVALHAAGVLAAPSALFAASLARGHAMAAAARNSAGAMLAVSADATRTSAALAGIEGVVLANHNSPRQTVIAGPTDAIAAAERALKTAQLTSVRLPVATAFHSPIVAAAVEPFARELSRLEFTPARLPVFANTTAAPYPSDAAAIRQQLSAQLAAPVRFVDQVRAMHAAGARIFVEVGPGQVLTRLLGDNLAGLPHLAVALDDRKTHGVTAFFAGLGALAAAGVPVRFDALWEEFAPVPADPPPRSKATVRLDGAQYGKPYPNRLPPLPAPSATAPTPAPAATPPPVAPTVSKPAPAVAAPGAPFPHSTSTMPTSQPAPVANGNGSHAPFPVAPPPTADWSHSLVALQHNMLAALNAHQRALHESYVAYVRASELALRQMSGGAIADLGHVHANGNGHSHGHAPHTNGNGNGHSNGSHSPFPGLPVIAPAPIPVFPAVPLAPTHPGNGNGHAHRAPDAHTPSVTASPRTLPAPTTNGRHAPAPAAAPTPPPPAPIQQSATPATPPPATSPAAASASPADAATLLFQVVAEATGYPAEMLKPEMQLEADLGIDSIKRVEIFAALSGKLPHLGQLEPAQVAKLGTLGAIADFIGRDPAAFASTAPAASTTQPQTTAKPAVDRAAPQWEERPAPGFKVPGLRAAAPAFLTSTSSTVAAPLAARLRSVGIETHTGPTPSTATRLLVCLQGLEPDAPGASPTARLHAAFASVRAAAPGLAQPGALLVVACDRTNDPWGAGVTGLARTAAREWPGLRIKILDIDTSGRDASAVADLIARELLTGFDDIEVHFPARGRRRVLRWQLLPAATGPDFGLVPTDPAHGRSVWLVSGGARGVTPACLAALAQRAPVSLALLGRTPLETDPAWAADANDEAALKRAFLAQARSAATPPTPAQAQAAVQRVLGAREARAAIAALEAAGAHVKYFACDVADRAAVARVAAEVRAAWGPIHGIVHAAGVLADKRIADKTDEQFARVVSPKVDGLRALLDATRDDPLTHLAAFTSVAGAFGNAGQSDYALANTTLDAVLAHEQQRRGATCRVRAFAWGPWDGGMVNAALRQHFAAQGISLLPRAAGADCFARELLAPASADAPVALVCGTGIAAWLPKPAARSDTLTATLSLNLWLHPWLDDHRVQGTPVLPIVVAGELCARAAALLAPTLHLRCAHDLRALHGIRLADDRSLWLDVVVERAANDRINCRINAADDGREHYRMEAELAAALPATTPAPAWTAAPLPAWNETAAALYRRVFHGPRFQCVKALHGRSNDALEIELGAPPAPLDDTPETWRHPCAWLDAPAHAALAHAQETHGTLLLPQRMRAQEFFAPFPPAGRVRARLQRRHEDALHERWDIAYLDAADGRLLSLLHDLTLIKVAANAATPPAPTHV